MKVGRLVNKIKQEIFWLDKKIRRRLRWLGDKIKERSWLEDKISDNQMLVV